MKWTELMVNWKWLKSSLKAKIITAIKLVSILLHDSIRFIHVDIDYNVLLENYTVWIWIYGEKNNCKSTKLLKYWLHFLKYYKYITFTIKLDLLPQFLRVLFGLTYHPFSFGFFCLGDDFLTWTFHPYLQITISYIPFF